MCSRNALYARQTSPLPPSPFPSYPLCTCHQKSERPHDGSAQRGLMMAVHRSLSFQLNHLDAAPCGRYLILDAIFDDITFVIVNIFAPNSHQKRLFKLIMKKLSRYPKECIMLCVDFNDTIGNTLDASNQRRQGPLHFFHLHSETDMLFSLAQTCTIPSNAYMGQKGTMPSTLQHKNPTPGFISSCSTNILYNLPFRLLYA